MVYIGRDGQVLERRPWSLGRLIEIIAAFFTVVLTFFRTMLAPLIDASNDFRGPRGGRGGGGGGWGGGGGGGGGRPGPGSGSGPRPNRRIGRIMTMPECNVPGGG